MSERAPLPPITDDAEHAAALARIEALMEAESGTPEGAELEALAAAVERYEDGRWPIRRREGGNG